MALPIVAGALLGGATRVGVGRALGEMAKDAAIGAGKGFVGGLKGAMMSEAPGLTGAYAFGKELRSRANAPKASGPLSSGGSSNQSSNSSSSSAMGGGLTAGISTVAGQQKQSNVINLEQVRQLRQLNNNVINQSKLIAFQVNETKRKELFAEEIANEQALRDEKLLTAIQNIGGNGKGGSGSTNQEQESDGIFTSILKGLGKLATLLTVGTVAAIPVILNQPRKPGTSSSVTGRDAENDPAGAARRAKDDLATRRTIPRPADYVPPAGEKRPMVLGAGKREAEKKQKAWDAQNASTHDPVTGMPKNSMIMRPPATGTVSSKFGIREDPISGKNTQHNGVDIAMPMGTPVFPVAKGEVIAQTTGGDAGTYVSIEHPDGKVSEYMHLSRASVKVGDLVSESTEIGKSGGAKGDKGAGKSTGPHLHLQIRDSKGGQFIDPVSLPGLTHLVVNASVKSTDSAPALKGPVVQPGEKSEAAARKERKEAYRAVGTDYNAVASPSGLESFLKGKEPAPVSAGVKPKGGETSSSSIKAEVLKSLSGKNLNELKVLRKEVENPRLSPQYMGLTDSDKSEILKAIDEEIKNKTVSTSGAFGTLSEAEVAAMIPDFSKRYPGIQLAAGPGFNLGGGGGGDWDGQDKIVTSRRVTPDGQGGYTGGFVPNLSLVANKPPPTSNGPTGYNEDYLQSVIDGKHPRPMVSVEKAQELLNKLKAGGGNDSIYSLSGMGGGTGLQFKKEKTQVIDKDNLDVAKKQLAQAKEQQKAGSQIKTQEAKAGIAQQTKVFKPLFKNNSDIIADANKAFLQQFRSTATNAINQGLTKALFPKGVGVSAGQAGRDDMYRGQQLQKIFGTDKVINDTTTKLLGKQYGPMFAPLFNNLAQGYLEVGSRVAGKAIFQGIGGLGAQETQTITGQVLGNFAAGNKKLALEQLLYGASGGSKSGIALGPETLLAKYGFANPMEGISYFASALGERATQPFAKLMGADDRDKSVIFDPRTKKYVYADTGAPASQADINASGNYGAPVSQSTVFSPGMNNYGMAFDPYGTTAGVNGTYKQNAGGSQFQQIIQAKPGTGPNRAQYFGLTDQEQARGGDKLIAEQNTLLRAQGEVQNKQLEQQAKLAEESAKRQLDIAMKQASSQAEADAAQAAFDKALNEAKTSTDRVDTDRVISKLDQVGGKGSSGTQILDKDGNPVNRKSGQLFDSNVYKDGRIVGSDPMKEIGNFGFDMLKNAAGNALTKNIKNPYAQMVANFAIQKGLNYGVDKFLGPMFDKGLDFLTGSSGVTGLDGFDFASDLLPAADIDLGFFDFLGDWGLADGGPVTGPGTGRSDSIPAMLSNGEFVVNAAASKKYRPLLDALNYTKYADGTPSTSGSGNALFKATGVDKQLNALGDQTDLLTSIDGSLRVISGQGTSSGTGLAFDSGLGSLYGGSGGGSISSGGAGVMNGVARSRRTQQKPSTMDYVEAIGGTLLKSYAIKTGINMASTAAFGATPMAMAGNFISGVSTGFTHGAGAFAGDTIVAVGTESGLAVGSSIAEFFGMGSAATTAATTTASTAAVAAGTEATAMAVAPELAAMGPVGWTILAAVVLFSVYGGGGGGSAPPPKEPKYHAGIYVAGNNNINAIAPILETVDYHAPPEGYKTVAYGLLRVAFNATKSSEAVTNMTASYDFIYMKVQFDKISMIVGKGAPNSSYTQDGATDTLSWPAPTESTNLSAIASDIINWVKDDFKKLAKAENLGKLDKAAAGLETYTLDELSKGLIPDLARGKYKLDQSKEKGIYANNVAESNRIAQLIDTANKQKAYMSEATGDTYEENSSGGQTLIPGSAGKNMVYSLKDGKFIESAFPGALLIDTAGRPVYDIEGTSAGLSVEDFVSSAVAGSSRQANILVDTPASTAGGAGSTTVTTITGPKVDNSAVTNYFIPTNGLIDVVRGATPQVG